MMGGRGTKTLAQVAARATRQFSTKEPKLHKAKHHWTDFKAKRPVDQDDLHVRYLSADIVLLEIARLTKTTSALNNTADIPPSLQQINYSRLDFCGRSRWVWHRAIRVLFSAVQAGFLEIDHCEIDEHHFACRSFCLVRK